MHSTSTIDRAATALSLACVAHCVALPAVAIALPVVGVLAEEEWIHWLLTGLAIIASSAVIGVAHSARTAAFLVPVLLGVSLITSALFADQFGFDETPPTVIGGLLLAAAHIQRLVKHP